MEKVNQINEIKRMIGVLGTLSSVEMELESSPCISSKGNGKNNISELVETFYNDSVEVVTYHGEDIIRYDNVDYENLSEDIIDEIHSLIETHETSLEKTFKRCQN